MNDDGVNTAFEIILEELGSIIKELNEDAAKKLQLGQCDYQGVKEQMETGERLTKFQDRIIDLCQEWNDSFDADTRGKTVFEGRAEFISLAKGEAEIEMHYGVANAKGKYSNGNVVVLPGSTLRKKSSKSMGRNARAYKERLLREGKIENLNDQLLSVKSQIEFDSPSGSAKFVAGCSVNGRKEWHLISDHRTLGDWIKEHCEG